MTPPDEGGAGDIMTAPIFAMRVITTLTALVGVIIFLAVILRKRKGRGFRVYGLMALSWLLGNYVVYWATGKFPQPFYVAGATLALTSYIVAGGLYAVTRRPD